MSALGSDLSKNLFKVNIKFKNSDLNTTHSGTVMSKTSILNSYHLSILVKCWYLDLA